MPRCCRHRLDQALGADRVGRIEHDRVRHGAHHRQILEPHLRRAVLADRHAAVRAGELEVGARDRRHADVVEGARQEAGEGRDERDLAARRQADRDADHVLLGDEALEVALRVRGEEALGEGRVLGVAVDHRDQRIDRCRAWPARCRTLRASPPGRRPCTRGARHRLARRRSPRPRRSARRDRAAARRAVPRRAPRRPPSSSSAPFFTALPCQLSLSAEGRDALPLLGARDDRHRLLAHRARSRRRRATIAAMSWPSIGDRVPAEAREARGVAGDVVAVHRALALPEGVDVDDRDQVVELVVRRDRDRLPHRALGHLAVAEQHVDALVAAVELLGVPAPRRRRPTAPGRASRSRPPCRRSAASGGPRARCRCGAASAAARPEWRRPRPTRRRAAAPRAPSTARSDRRSDCRDPPGRSA